MVHGFPTFKDFQPSGEAIATNVLADRLLRLESRSIIAREVDAKDLRRVNYRLTEKGIDLAPVVFDLLIWGAHPEQTSAPYAVIDVWDQRDLTPFLPKFKTPLKPGKGRI